MRNTKFKELKQLIADANGKQAAAAAASSQLGEHDSGAEISEDEHETAAPGDDSSPNMRGRTAIAVDGGNGSSKPGGRIPQQMPEVLQRALSTNQLYGQNSAPISGYATMAQPIPAHVHAMLPNFRQQLPVDLQQQQLALAQMQSLAAMQQMPQYSGLRYQPLNHRPSYRNAFGGPGAGVGGGVYAAAQNYTSALQPSYPPSTSVATSSGTGSSVATSNSASANLSASEPPSSNDQSERPSSNEASNDATKSKE